MSFENLKVLEVIQANCDSAQGRPAFYQKFHKIISVMLKIEFVHEDDAANPAGESILFITLIQKHPQANWFITELGSGP